jgi:putative oxidoreductase
MFPPGSPGVALVLLRASVAFAVLQEYYGHRPGFPGWVQGPALLVACTLTIGYLTPVASLAAIVLHSLIFFAPVGGNTYVAIVLVLDTMALGLLGPGAYSLDAHLFGRRIVVLPPEP